MVVCNFCGREWTRHPAWEIECPLCHARIGSRCKRPSGHGCETHAGREQLAVDRGLIEICPASVAEEDSSSKQTSQADLSPIRQSDPQPGLFCEIPNICDPHPDAVRHTATKHYRAPQGD